MKRFILIFLFFINLHSYCQSWEWFEIVNSGENSIHDRYGRGYNSVTADQNGNVYVIGNFPAVNFGDTIYSLNDNSIFLAKFNERGERQWINFYSGDRDARAYSVKVDHCGNVYFLGNPTYGYIYIDTNAQSPLFTAFLAKLNPDGKLLWVEPIPSPGNNIHFDLDEDGNAYMAFKMSASGYFGSNYINSFGSTVFCIGKMDTDGNPMWFKHKTSPLSGFLHRIAYNKGKLIAAQLMYNGDYAFQIDTANGSTIRTFNTSTGAFRPTAVEIDENKNFLIAGEFEGNIKLGNTNLSEMGVKDLALVSFDSTGTKKWHKHFYATVNVANRVAITDISADKNGNSYVSGSFSENFRFGTDSVNTIGGYYNGFITKYTAGGHRIFREIVEQVNPNPPVQVFEDNEIRDVEVFNDSILYVVGGFKVPKALFDKDTVHAIGSYKHSFYLSRFIDQTNASIGNVYYDLNSNGKRDSSEIVLSNHLISVINAVDTLYTFTDHDGDYTAFTKLGNTIVRLKSPPKNWTVSPGSFLNSNAILDKIYKKQDFALQPIANRNDLAINIACYSSLNVGSAAKFKLEIKNVGTTNDSGIVELQLDTMLKNLQFDVLPSFINGNFYQWNLPLLAPAESQSIHFSANLNSHLNVNDTVIVKALINTTSSDSDSLDNEDSLRLLIRTHTSSNYTWAEPEGDLSLSYLKNSQAINYLLSFQNVSGDSLNELRLSTQLSHLLDLGSLQIISSSHDINATIDTKSNLITFTVKKTKLPDSSISYLNSNGFINYTIQPKRQLTAHDTLYTNTTAYFHNCAFNSSRSSLSFVDTAITTSLIPIVNNTNFLIYPNPTIDYLIVEGEMENLKIYSIEGKLINVKGKVQNVGPDLNKIDVSELSQGIYILKKSNGQALFQKL